MVFNGGKGGQPSPGPSACGSRLCRCLGFVLLVVIGVLLYTCMTLVSRNDALSDRVLMYARELTKTRTKELSLEKRTVEMRQQNMHCHSQLSERSREFAMLKVDTDSFKRQANEFHQKLETMAMELKTKEDACVQMNNLCKNQTLEHEDELKRMKELQGTANAECEKKVIIELARVIRILRAKYGAEPITELAKAGVDVTRILPFMGGSQLPDSNQLQRSGQDQLQPKSDQQKLNSDEERPKSGQQQPNADQEKLKSGQQQPNSDQEQPKSFQEQPVQGQLQFKRPEDIKRDEDQKQRSEREKLNEDGREKQNSTQEQPKKADQTEEEKNKSETEDAKSLAQDSDRSNRDERQRSMSGREKFGENEEKEPKQDDAKGGQENSRDDKERASSDPGQPKEDRANEEEKDKLEKKDAKPGQEDVNSSQKSDRYKADEK